LRRAMHRGYAVRWDQVDSIHADHCMLLKVTRAELMTMAELVGEGAS